MTPFALRVTPRSVAKAAPAMTASVASGFTHEATMTVKPWLASQRISEFSGRRSMM